MMGGEGSIWPRERRGGIPSRTTQSRRSTKHTQEERALSYGTDYFTAIFCRVQPRLQKLAHHSQLGRWQTTTVALRVDIAHNLREDFTGLYWWHGPIRRGQPPRCFGRPTPRSQGRFSTLFGLCGCWSYMLKVAGLSRAVLGCPGLSGLSWVAGCGTFAASDSQ